VRLRFFRTARLQNLYPPDDPWDLHIIYTALAEAGGPALVPTECIDDADIIFVGIYGPRSRILEARKRHGHHAILVWLASENNDINHDGKPQEERWVDDLVDVVDVSLGQARMPLPPGDPDAPTINRSLHAPNFLRWPWWGGNVFEDEGRVCRFHPELFKMTSPNEWLARRQFATMLIRHVVYPRAELAASVGRLSVTLDASAPRPDGVARALECPHSAPAGCAGEFRCLELSGSGTSFSHLTLLSACSA
jgi:hypothetical protein